MTNAGHIVIMNMLLSGECLPKKYGPVAQLGERSVRIREVEGSNPFGSTIARRYELFIVRNVFGLTIKIEDR